MLKLESVSVTLNNKIIVDKISLEIFKNDFVALIGANGSGKSTLVKSIGNYLKYDGNIFIDGINIKNFSSKERAKNVSVLLQNNSFYGSYTIFDVVAMGRYAHKGLSTSLTKEDKQIIDESICFANIEHLRNKLIDKVSGGELQRVFLARAFAQQAKLLILDEPVNHLDIEHQVSILKTIDNWRKKDGNTVLCVMHDINHALSYSNKAIALKQGRIIHQGETTQVINHDSLKDVFNFDVYGYMKEQTRNWING